MAHIDAIDAAGRRCGCHPCSSSMWPPSTLLLSMWLPSMRLVNAAAIDIALVNVAAIDAAHVNVATSMRLASTWPMWTWRRRRGSHPPSPSFTSSPLLRFVQSPPRRVVLVLCPIIVGGTWRTWQGLTWRRRCVVVETNMARRALRWYVVCG